MGSGNESFDVNEDLIMETDDEDHFLGDDGDDILTDISKSTTLVFNMPDTFDLTTIFDPQDALQQQYNAPVADLQQPQLAVSSNSNMGSSTFRAMDPQHMEPIPLKTSSPDQFVSPSIALVHQLQPGKGPQQQHPSHQATEQQHQQQQLAPSASNFQAMSEFLRFQQAFANQPLAPGIQQHQLLQLQELQQQHQQLQQQQLLHQQQQLQQLQLQQQPPLNQFATLTTSQHTTLQVPVANAMPTMIQGPWGYAQIHPKYVSNWEAIQTTQVQQQQQQAFQQQQQQALQSQFQQQQQLGMQTTTQGAAHPGNAPTSMVPSFATSSAGSSPESIMGVPQDRLAMESSLLTHSPPFDPQASGMAVTRPPQAAATSSQALTNPSSVDDGENEDAEEEKPVVAARKPVAATAAKTTLKKAIVRPKTKDVCFALINHPGTKVWREKVDSLSMHIDLEWSDRVHQAVRTQLEGEGRRFLLCVKSSSAQSKGVKNKEWRPATDEEIMLKTKQRFRDWRKTPKTDIKKPRGRPSNKSKAAAAESQATSLVRRFNGSTVEVRTAFFEAIQQCTQTMEQARTSDDGNAMERGRQAQEKLELLIPMHQLRWSHVLENELLQRQSAAPGSGQDVLMLLDMQSDRAKQHDRITKLKKAEIQVVNFIQCLMENGSNELNAALSSVRWDNSDGSDDDDHGDGGDDGDDDEDEEDDDDDPGPDDANARSRHASLDTKPHARKRGRGPGASEADADYYQYDLLTVFQATPLAFTLKTGDARPLPPLDIEFEKKALSGALLDAANVGVQVDVEFEVATTDRLSAFLSKGECHVMHLTCHGHPDYLALDNGWGGMQIIRVQDLEPLIRFGAGNLELVFLSSCCSRPAGEAFVAAGVPHVICCHHDQKPRDKVAIEFARHFYRALACGKTVKVAFDLARQSTHVSPQGSPSEADKFVLLPETPEDSLYHDVPIFKERHRSLRGLSIPNNGVTRPIPCLPGNVKMNSLDVYHVLELLSYADVVKIISSTGGRRLAAAVASYIRSRPHTMNLDDIVWFPPVVESDDASINLRRVCDVLMMDSPLSRDDLMGEGSRYFSDYNEAMSYFAGKRCLFVMNAKQFKSDAQRLRLERFACDLLDDFQMKIIMVCGDGEELYSRLPKHCQQVVPYTPLRFDPDTLYEDAKAARSPCGSNDGVVGGDESLSELSEASLPFEIHVSKEMTMSEAKNAIPSSTAAGTGEFFQSASAPSTTTQVESRSRKRSKETGTQQLEALLEHVTLTSSRVDEKRKGKSKKKGAPRRLRRHRDDDDDSACTSASSDSSSVEAPPTKPVGTLDAYDATMSSRMAEQTIAQISRDGRSKAGNKGGDSYSEVTPFLKQSASQGFRLDTAGKARLYGRDNEISFLKDAYNRIALSGASSEIVGVHGYSGTGKSTLVKHLEEIVAIDKSGIFASGKFDQINAAARPYSAIVDAVSRLCGKIADDSGFESVKLSIQQALGPAVRVIAELIPAISQLTEELTTEQGSGGSTEYAFTRFKELFRAFMRAVSSPNQPVVLFLDDLQWADNASLALIESLASDPESKNILFVWAYRDDESGDEAKNLVERVSKTSSLSVSDVSVGAVDSKFLKEMIADLVRFDGEKVQELCDLLSRRTAGNIHFVIQFLHMLQQERLLFFSEDLEKWDWDIEQIETRTVVTENVADLLTTKIARQPGDVQSILQLAACLGFFFDIQLLESVASSEGLLSEIRPPPALLPYADPEEIEPGDLFFSSDHGHTKFLRLLQIARKESLVIQTHDPYKFKFAHDRVRQCVYDMIRNPEKREELHLRIGMLIWKQNKSKTMDEMSHFLAIDQLNRGSRHIKDEDTKSKLAQLNLESAGKAVKKSAYTLAADFLGKGIALLNPRTMWQKQTYDLCLELHNKSAEMESTHGNFDASDSRVDTVLHRARTLDEKLRAYYVKLDSLGVRRRMDEAISLGLEVLRQIGEKIAQHPSTFSIVVELTKTKRVLKGRKGHELLTLHEMSDDRRAAAMRLLNSIAFFAWHSDRNDVLTFVFLRMTRITLNHGLCKYSPFAFAAFGMVLGVLGDIQQAYDFGTLALQLLERGKTTDCTCSTHLVVFAFLEHLKKPLTLIGINLVEAFKVGMESGQVHYACQCLSAVGGLNVVSGKPLRAVIVDARRQRRIFHEYNQQFADVLTAPWHQFALNMTGQAENLRVLSGEALDETIFLNETVFTIAKVNVHYIRMILLYIIGDFEAACVELEILEGRAGNNTEGTHFMAYFIVLFSGLVSLAMAQKTRRRKYFIGSRKYINHIWKFTKGGGLNCTPMLMVMQAIQKTMERGKSMLDVKSAFDNAIVACTRSGFMYLEGIANERAGEFMLSCGDEAEAQTYLNRAWQLFSEWDADAKVEIMEKKYAKLRSTKETPSLPSSSLQVVEVQEV